MPKKRGRPELGYTIPLDVAINEELDRALRAIAEGTGWTRAAVVRQLLTDSCAFVGLASPSVRKNLIPTTLNNEERK